MNKQEAIEKIKNIGTLNIHDKVAGQQVDMVIKNEVLDIIPKIDEPQKVTIPKFVAEWIETHKRCMPFLSHLFTDNLDEELKEWLDFSDNQNLMAKAWMYGYEIEKEKLYTVEIPDPYGMYKIRYLIRNSVGNIRIGGSDYRDVFLDAETHLTESEIKKDFDFLWQFAKEVE